MTGKKVTKRCKADSNGRRVEAKTNKTVDKCSKMAKSKTMLKL